MHGSHMGHMKELKTTAGCCAHAVRQTARLPNKRDSRGREACQSLPQAKELGLARQQQLLRCLANFTETESLQQWGLDQQVCSPSLYCC